MLTLLQTREDILKHSIDAISPLIINAKDIKHICIYNEYLSRTRVDNLPYTGAITKIEILRIMILYLYNHQPYELNIIIS